MNKNLFKLGYGIGGWSPLSLGPSLAAWYSADVGCYTDAACLFASASSQYLTKSSPTFAPTTKMTIAVDVKVIAYTGAPQTICARWGGAANQFLYYISDAGTVYIYLSDGIGGSPYFYSTNAIPAGVNARVVLVYDGAQATPTDRVKIYFDGVLQTGTNGGDFPTTLAASADTLVIGAYAAGSLPFNGALARLGFSSQALSGAALTAAHTSTFWASMTAARQADWFSFYNLCEASGTRVDSTGLNDLTAVNTPTVAAGPGEGLAVNNSPRKRINDASGSARHREQATIGKQPLYLAAIQNGRAVGRFDGTDDVDAVVAALGAQPITVFFALKTSTAEPTIQWDGSGAGRCLMGLGFTGAGQVGLYAGAFIGAAHVTGAYHIYEATYDGASSSLLVDGASVLTGDPGAQGLDGFYVGGSTADAQFSAMDECESFIVVGAMTAAQRASARAYLKARWGTP